MATSLALTRNNIIASALRKLGIIEAGGSASAEQILDAAEALNIIVKSFDSATWFKSFSKSISATASITGSSPSTSLASDVAWVEAATFTVSGIDYPLELISSKEYANLAAKGREATHPDFAFVSNDLSTPTIYVYPEPVATGNVTYWYRRKIDLFDSSSDVGDFPDQWYRVLILMLTAELSYEYRLPLEERMLLDKRASESLNFAMQDQNTRVTSDLTGE